MYFHKISNALGMQCIVAVSSVKQMLMALRLPGIRAVSINNRDMATWALHPSRVENILGDPEGEETYCLVMGELCTRGIGNGRALDAKMLCVDVLKMFPTAREGQCFHNVWGKVDPAPRAFTLTCAVGLPPPAHPTIIQWEKSWRERTLPCWLRVG